MRTIITIVLFFLSFSLFATAQFSDILFLNGKEYSLHSNPLEEYFEEYPDNRPETESRCSALWRGYVASFEIKNKKLILKDIKIMIDIDNWKSVKRDFLEKDKTKDEDEYYKEDYKPVKLTWYQKFIAETTQKDFVLDWFTGVLVLPYGKILNYVHMGYGSTYENYILLEVDEGKLIKEMKLNAKEYQLFREVQFSEFKKTKKYKEMSKNLVDDNNNKEFIEGFLRDFVISYTSKPLDKK